MSKRHRELGPASFDTRAMPRSTNWPKTSFMSSRLSKGPSYDCSKMGTHNSDLEETWRQQLNSGEEAECLRPEPVSPISTRRACDFVAGTRPGCANLRPKPSCERPSIAGPAPRTPNAAGQQNLLIANCLFTYNALAPTLLLVWRLRNPPAMSRRESQHCPGSRLRRARSNRRQCTLLGL